MTYLFVGFMAGIAVWFLGPIVTKTVVTSLKKIKEAYDKD